MHSLDIAARCVLGTIFLVSSTAKTAGRGAFGAFAASLPGLVRVAPRAARPLAALVVAAEFTVCVLLAVPVPVAGRAGHAAAAALLLAFAAVIGAGLRRGGGAECRCFGRGALPLRPRHLVRNVLLAAAALTGAAVTGAAARSPGAGGAALAAGVGVTVGVLVTQLDALTELFAPASRRPDATRHEGKSHARPDRRRGADRPDRRPQPGTHARRDQAAA
ncbi:MauE/DoxX family redox-associated membrane protein [Streptomyces sp. TRM64462]|uniref:MauE/DoxX family redox-associated membrane protein n=1 Tax=Streptomyces sp. TRM64462 TaxID=2741726 RepID=UPI001585E00D|nr:MauE/DoxX family redox-associated membrane protein [Streptomyces sp. TRM64462]